MTVQDVFEVVGRWQLGQVPAVRGHTRSRRSPAPATARAAGSSPPTPWPAWARRSDCRCRTAIWRRLLTSRARKSRAPAGARSWTLVERQLRPRDICTRAAFENAARVVAATGGSTNGALHLPAMAHECGHRVRPVRRRRDLQDRRPTSPTSSPAGKYVAKDMYEAGGVYMVMKTLLDGGLLDPEPLTVTGKTLGENIDEVTWNPDQKVIYDAKTPDHADRRRRRPARHPRARRGDREGRRACTGCSSAARRKCSNARRTRSPRSKPGRSAKAA